MRVSVHHLSREKTGYVTLSPECMNLDREKIENCLTHSYLLTSWYDIIKNQSYLLLKIVKQTVEIWQYVSCNVTTWETIKRYSYEYQYTEEDPNCVFGWNVKVSVIMNFKTDLFLYVILLLSFNKELFCKGKKSVYT